MSPMTFIEIYIFFVGSYCFFLFIELQFTAYMAETFDPKIDLFVF